MSVRPHSAARNNTERLAVRRRKQRRRVQVVGAVLFFVLLGTGIYGLWRPGVRISHITVEGTGMPLDMIATKAMEGSYLGIIPRDSIFFFSASDIRASLLAAHPEVAAVSITRDGFTGLSIRTERRIPVARWCGLAPTPDVEEYCYLFDAHGYVFAAAATTTQTINPFNLYAPIAGDEGEVPIEPLRATLARAEDFPSVFDFARQLVTGLGHAELVGGQFGGIHAIQQLFFGWNVFSGLDGIAAQPAV